MTAPSKTFCILPWIHVYANPDGNVLPCCIGDWKMPMGNVQENTIDEIMNNDRFKTMRSKMLQGERCEECMACYSNEEAGNNSFRQSVNIQFEKYIPDALSTQSDGTLDEMKLRYLDVRWSNICNFKCRSCSSTYSSSWATEDGKDKVYIFAGGDTNDDLYKQFEPHFDTIEEFYFAGGEPLLTDKHYAILEYLIEHGRTDVKLRYNSNLSVLRYKNKNIIDLWKQFENVNVGASIDSWGERAEYIREGTDWNTLENNIRLIRRETPHVNLQTDTVVSIFNVLTIPELMRYLIDNELVDVSKYNPQFYNIINPECYSIKLLDRSKRAKIIDRLLNCRFSDRIDSKLMLIVNHLRDSEVNLDLRDELKLKNLKYDTIRLRNFKKTFPELEATLWH